MIASSGSVDTPLRKPIAQVFDSFRSTFVTVGLFSAVINFLMLVPAIYMLQVYDRVLPSRNEMTLLMLTILLLGLLALMGGLEYVRSMLVIRLGSRLDLQLSGAVHNATFQANLRGDALQAGQTLEDVGILRQFLAGSALFACFDAPWFPVYLAVIFLFDSWLGVFALLGSLTLIFLAWLSERVTSRLMSEAGSLRIQSQASVTAHLRNAEVISAMGMLTALFRRWLTGYLESLRRQQMANERAAAVTTVTRFVRLSLQSLVLGFGALLAVDGRITPGMMVAASILTGRALAPIEQLISVWKQWHGALHAGRRLDTLLLAYPQLEVGMALPRPTGKLSLERVTALPPGVRPGPGARMVFSQVTLALPAGGTLGVIGPSGSGKSTLARLLIGAYPPTAGRIRLDGADVSQWNKEVLGPTIGYLPQDVELFAGTLSENIARFGEVDADKVVRAARQAGVHELILQLPRGYDTPLGENGTGLSGGQRQRIGLARALYGDPVFVVLDEPNANLDDAGNAALIKALHILKDAGTTVVVITHLRPLLALTSHILKLSSGQPAVFGSTKMVLKTVAQSPGGNA